MLQSDFRVCWNIVLRLPRLKGPACPVKYQIPNGVKKHRVQLKIFTPFYTGFMLRVKAF